MFKNTDHISQKTHRVFLTRANGLMLYKLQKSYEINLMQILFNVKAENDLSCLEQAMT
jgi:hypothetical protein